jgi:hypothetical protein
MKKILTVSTSFALVLTQASSVFAQTLRIDQPPLVKFPSIGKLISNGISLIMIIAAIATFFYLVWGGLEWITSGGEKAGTEAARSKITNAFIGLFVVFAAWAIMKFIEQFFGICILGCDITPPTP